LGRTGRHWRPNQGSGQEHPFVAKEVYIVQQYGGRVLQPGKHEESLRYYLQALQIQRKDFADVHPDISGTEHNHNIGLVLKATGKVKEVRSMFIEEAAMGLWPDVPLVDEAADRGTL
jgi:hypothetical protein